MKLIVNKTEIRISAAAFIMPVLMMTIGLFAEYMAVFLSMLLHELSHVAAAGICGANTDKFSISALGFSASISFGSCSRKLRIYIYSAGPIFNLAVFFASAVLEHILPGEHGYIRLILLCNLLLGSFNLLPVLPLDGGRLILEMLSGAIGSNAAGRTVRRIAWLVCLVMILAGIYQMYISTFNISLFIISAYIFINIKSTGLESGLMSIREIIYRRSKLIRRGVYPARDIVVMKETLLGESLKSMDFDRFHIVYVLDDDLHIIATYTENEIMDALAEQNDSITFGQFVDLHKDKQMPGGSDSTL